MAIVILTARRMALRRPVIELMNLDILLSHSCPLFSVPITELTIELRLF